MLKDLFIFVYIDQKKNNCFPAVMARVSNIH